MKVISEMPFAFRPAKREFLRLEDYAQLRLHNYLIDGEEDLLARSFGRLLDVLHQKGLIPEDEVREVFEDESLRIVEDDG